MFNFFEEPVIACFLLYLLHSEHASVSCAVELWEPFLTSTPTCGIPGQRVRTSFRFSKEAVALFPPADVNSAVSTFGTTSPTRPCSCRNVSPGDVIITR